MTNARNRIVIAPFPGDRFVCEHCNIGGAVSPTGETAEMRLNCCPFANRGDRHFETPATVLQCASCPLKSDQAGCGAAEDVRLGMSDTSLSFWSICQGEAPRQLHWRNH